MTEEKKIKKPDSISYEKGILLVNLGSPDSPTESDVRRYLNQFLMDKRVLDVPYLLRRLIVSLFILPFRPKKSAEAYTSIWWPRGSPLIVISERIQRKVQAKLPVPVLLGMRYGNPSIEKALRFMHARGMKKIFLLPLYPHYAMSTVETVVAEAERVLKKIKDAPELDVLPPFYDKPEYIAALTHSASFWLEGDFDHLLFSYHGLPERHLRKTDPTGSHCLQTPDCCSTPSPAHATCYRHQCYRTTQLFAEKFGLPENRYSVAFQSRLGRDPWLQPYTDAEITRLARSGVKRLRVICPAFVSDCLETLEEIGIRGKETFLAAGGEDFRLVPCMNDNLEWIKTIVKWCREWLSEEEESQ